MKHIFSPWRSSYIDSFKMSPRHQKNSNDTIFSDIPKEDDDKRMVVYRGKFSFVIMNLYPYNAGHLLVVPYLKTSDFSILSPETRLEIMDVIDLSTKVLEDILQPQGFNIGLNLGEVAGGSVSNHLHFHIVPRWGGDSNFMLTVGDVKLVSSDMKALYRKLKHCFQQKTQGSSAKTA